jgi:hypothetical protein
LCEYGKKPLEKKTKNGGEKTKMNAKYKKSLKIVTLLITAAFIATASAYTYTYMYINGSITIGTQQLIWASGADTPVGTTIVGGIVTMDLDVQPGVTQNFTECLLLKNNDTSTHSLNVTITTALSGSDFDSAKIYFYDNSTSSWVYSGTTLDMTSTAGQLTGSLAAGVAYRLTFEITADSAASGSKSFVLQVTY